jgi:GNAT superfamily N-acetyltransferase
MNTDLVIRPVRQEDHPAWQVLWDGYNAFYGRKGDSRLPTEVTRMTWSRFFESDEPVHALVAVRAGTVVGIGHYLFHRSTTSISPVCYLQDLFTAESARGTGVARAIIADIYARASVAGSSRVYWLTHETNVTAMKLYDQLAEKPGFVMYRHLL